MGLILFDRTLIRELKRKFRYVGHLDIETFDSPVDKDKNHEFAPTQKTESGNLWIPGRRLYAGPRWYSYRFINSVTFAPMMIRHEEEQERLKEPVFEVNMMEALIGWKAFCVEEGVLRSASQKTEWLPDQPLKAKCTNSESRYAKSENGCDSPMNHCSCGIYGGDKRQSAEEYLGHHGALGEATDNRFLGTIAGWGKYVRHSGGWRAQLAYPQSFYLKQNQEKFVPVLRKFHVPIFVETPFQVYSPEEDGYEHRTQEAYRNRGAVADSTAAEKGSTDDAA